MLDEPENGKCRVTGKTMFPDKKTAWADPTSKFGFGVKRMKWNAGRCPFCDAIHLTKSAGPRRGKKDMQKVTRGKRR